MLGWPLNDLTTSIGMPLVRVVFWYSQIGSVMDSSGKPVFATSDTIIRAGWNFFLIEGDDSFGVHNPRFARTVLLTTLDALK